MVQTNVVSEVSISALSHEQLHRIMGEIAAYKLRSDETHKNTHVPELEGITKPLDIVFLGDSMFERFKTTGGIHTFPGQVFNGGVGGDKIQNLIYRLSTLNLLSILSTKTITGIILLHIGTNNLKPKNNLPQSDMNAYAVLLASLHAEFSEAKILVTGLFPRKDIKKEIIDDANVRFAEIVEKISVDGRITLVVPPKIDLETDLEDHVHLNEAGYRIWNEALWNQLEGLK